MTRALTDFNGVIQTGVVLVLFGSQSLAGAEVQRAADVGGTAGSYTTVGFIDDVQEGGSPFFDYLPQDGFTRWYRCRHYEPGYSPSEWSTSQSAVPTTIPVRDWSSKPWLLANIVPLQLVMDVYSDSSASLFVTASVNRDPAGLGTPTVNVLSYSGIPSPPIPSGSSGWIVAKPSSGFGRVIFENTLPGRISDTDAVDVQAASGESTPSFLGIGMIVTASTAQTLGVSSSIYNPGGIAYGVGILSQSNVGGVSANGTGKWTITRPTEGEGTVVFVVTGSSNVIADTDTVYVSQDNLINLSCIAIPSGSNDLSMSVHVKVRDPHIILSSIGGVTITSSSIAKTGFTSSLASTLVATGLTTYVYNVTRPVYGQGMGRVTWEVTKTGYGRDSDSVEVPERLTGLAHLRTVATVTGLNETQQIVSVSAYDPLNQITPTVNYYIEPAGAVSVTGTNPYTIARPESGSVKVRFESTGTGRVADSDFVTVPPSDRIPLSLIMTVVSETTASMDVTASVDDPASTSIPAVGVLDYFGVPAPTLLGSGSWRITKPGAGEQGSVTFFTTASGRLIDTDTVTVTPNIDGLANLSTRASVTSMNSTQLIVSVSVVDPLGTATVSQSYAVQPAGSVGVTGTNPYTITRPPSGSAQVVFTGTAAGRVSDIDSVSVPANPSGVSADNFLGLVLTTTGFDSSSINVSASIINPLAVTTLVDVYKSNNVGSVASAGTNQWKITRPTSGQGSVTFFVTSSTANIVSDYDTVFIDKSTLYPLNVSTKVVTTTTSQIVVDVEVRDPLNSTSTLSGVTLTPTFVAQSGVTVNLDSTTPTSGLTTYRYTVTRPNRGQGTGRVTFAATKTNYLPDSDSIEIPERTEYALRSELRQLSSTSGSITFAMTGSDDTGGTAPIGTYTTNPTLTVTLLGSGSALSGSTYAGLLQSSSFTTASYQVSRPSGSSSTGTLTYKFSKADRTPTFVYSTLGEIPNGGGVFPPSIDAVTTDNDNMTNNTIDISWSVSNAPGGHTFDIQWSHNSRDGSNGPGLVEGVTSPYTFDTEDNGTMDMVAKGTLGYEVVTYNFQIRMKNGGGTVVATKETAWTTFCVEGAA